MSDYNRTGERKVRTPRYSSSIIFNLFALAMLLTAIIVLHQILNKPKQGEVKSQEATAAPAEAPAAPKAMAMPAELKTPPAPVKEEKQPVSVVDLPSEPKTVQKETESKKEETVQTETYKEVKKAVPVNKSTSTKTAASRQTSENYYPVEELDSESARQHYLKENKNLSKDKKTSSAGSREEPVNMNHQESAYQTPQKTMASTVDELDSESARVYYQEENSRLAKKLAKKEKRVQERPVSDSEY